MSSRNNYVDRVMGTSFMLDIFSELDVDPVVIRVMDRLNEIDRVFSTYKNDSEITRLGNGEITLDECSQDVRDVLQLCDNIAHESNGAFDIYAAAKTSPAKDLQCAPNARPLEPSGLVKGWAIDQGARILLSAGVGNFCLNIGGDVIAFGAPELDRGWRVGIRHPIERENVMAIVELRDCAVATSGFYERGKHIVSAGDTSLDEIISLSIVGPDIVLADAYATAAFAMGTAGVRWANGLPGFEVLAADASGITHASAGMQEYLAPT